MARVSDRALMEIKEELEAFKVAVRAAGYTADSAWTYIYHAEAFVRWLDYDFEPGAQLPDPDARQ